VAKTTLAVHGNSTSDFLKMMVVAEGKVGKTTHIAASCLGALPHQTKGLVDKPENLHILGFDEAFVDGLLRFIRESCKKSAAYTNLSVYDLTEVTRKASAGNGWDYGVLNAVQSHLQQIKAEVARGGVHAVIFSSLTGMSGGVKAGLAGAPDSSKKGSGMDQSKWDAMSHQLNSIRNAAQADTHHVFWEGHVTKKGGDDEDQKETMSVQGSAGKNWGFNVEQVVRLRREMAKYPGFNVDKVYMDTRPSLDFVSGGRGFNESLDAKEYDLVVMAEKLGKKVGGFKEAATSGTPTNTA
jgi:hypothetical protein